MKWRELYKDLKNVLLKHFRPEPETEPIEAQLMKNLARLQVQQKSLNEMRDTIGGVAKQLNNSEILNEFYKLQTLAPSESGGECMDHSDNVDRMFT